MKNKKLIALSLATTLTLGTVSAFATDTNFTDVSNTNLWYYNAVMKVAGEGLVQGYEGKFSPNASMTNIQFITVMVRLVDQSVDLSMQDGDKHWGNQAYQAGIDLGLYTTTEFAWSKMDSGMTREFMAAVAIRALELKGETVTTLASTAMISDYSSISTAYRADVVKAYSAGIIQGKTVNSTTGVATYDPQGTMTRAEAATIIRNMISPGDRAEVQLLPSYDDGAYGPDYSGSLGSQSDAKDLWDTNDGSLSQSDRYEVYDQLFEATNWDWDVLYANAPANNSMGLPTGSYYVEGTGNVNGTDKWEDYSMGGIQLASGEWLCIGMYKTDVEKICGSADFVANDGTLNYDSKGVNIQYNASGRVIELSVVNTSFSNYINKGLAYGTGSVKLGNTAKSSDLGTGEKWNEGSPQGFGLNIDGVTIKYTFGIYNDLWQGVTITASGL